MEASSRICGGEGLQTYPWELVTVECFSIFLRSFICSVAPRVYEMEKDHANFEDVKQPRLGSFFTKTIGWVAHRRR